jgi:GH18 family chitinase/Ca2+-binding RTX toxin-like protein
MITHFGELEMAISINKVLGNDVLLGELDSNLIFNTALIAQALGGIYEYLGKLQYNSSLEQELEIAFGNNFDREVASQIFSAFAKGDFSAIPKIQILSSNILHRANGAYSIDTNRIYLSAAFLAKNSDNPQGITSVLLEEIGHFIDSQINTRDAAGDEGDIFAKLVQGKSISQQELAVLQAEEDKATMTLNGQVVEIEMNVDGAHISFPFLWWLDNAGDNDGIMQGSDDDERIGGWKGKDVIKGGGGKDLLRGEEDDDKLHGQDGNDTLEGGNGNDRILGGDGDDKIDGGGGDDLIIGGNAHDEINGGNDWDIVDYEAGYEPSSSDRGIENHPNRSATLHQGSVQNANKITKFGFYQDQDIFPGRDILEDVEEIRATNADDTLYTDPAIGLKRLEGNGGNDKLYAISSFKKLFTPTYASNYIFGEDGDDILYADAAKDGYAQSLTGGKGKDIFVIGAPSEETDSLTITASQAVDYAIKVGNGINLATKVIAIGASFIKDIFWKDKPSGLTSDVVLLDDFKVGEDKLFLPHIADSMATGERYTFEPYGQQGQGGKGYVTIVAHRDSVLSEEIVRIASNSPKELALRLESDWQKDKSEDKNTLRNSLRNPGISEANSGNKIIGGYYPEWGTYDRNFQVKDVPADKLTHLFYAFAQIDQNGKAALFDPWAATDKPFPGDATSQTLKGNLNQLRILKEQHPNLKNMLSIGGWSLSGPFSTVASTPESRQVFAKSAVKLMTKYRTSDGRPIFDGIDVDWEFPVSGGASTKEVEKLAPSRAEKEIKYDPADKQNYVLLLKALRHELNAQAIRDSKFILPIPNYRYQLTIASAAGAKTMKNFDLKEISKYTDFFNIMAYDFHGSTWEPNQTNHQAALYSSGKDDIDSAIQAYVKKADSDPNDTFDRSDIVMGAPLYGRAWVGVPSTNDGLLQPANGTASGTWERGIFDYKDLHNRLQTQPESYKKIWDDTAKVPYIYSSTEGGMFSTYENRQSIGAKTNYIRKNGLGGMFFWDLSGDLPSSNPDSLVSKAASTLGVSS